MNVKKFTAATMDEALAKVKSTLGRDAVILHTRCYNRGGILGFGGRRLVEVTASDRVRVRERGAAVTSAVLDRTYGRPTKPSENLGEIRNDIAGLRAMIEELTRQARPSLTDLWPDALKSWYKHLCARGVSEETAVEMLEPLAARLAGQDAGDPRKIRRMVVERLASSLKTAPPITPGEPGRPALVAMVGPTGVGKTTTIAKLAAQFVLREKKPVGLVTLDTYRIAAVEQLRTYARIIDVPLEVALAPADLSGALERLSGCSLVFIDTAGRSQRDSMKMNDLKTFFSARRPDQIHLVLSATAERAAIAEVVDRFGMYRPDRVLLTKLDEMPACGKLLDISMLTPQPVSYLATGQDVPDDIKTARPEHLAALIAGEVSLDC